MNKTTKHMLAAAAIAGIVGISSTSIAKDAKKGGKKAAKANTFECVGGNTCAGNSCGSPNGCGGKATNACAGQGKVMTMDQKTCDAAKAKAEEAKLKKAGGDAKSPS